LAVFQSQKYTLPSASPEAKNYPSAENVTPQAYPADTCPLKFFLRFILKFPALVS